MRVNPEATLSIAESESAQDRQAYLLGVLGKHALEVMLTPDLDRYRIGMGPKTSEDDKIGFLYAAIQDLEFAGYSAAQIASIFKNHGAADASSYERGYTFPISILVQTGHFDACMERIVPLLEQKLAEI